MKTLVLLVILAISPALFADDQTAIRAAALDYAEGWYAGDGDRMARALHPDLAKRIARGEKVENMDATRLVEATRRGFGKKTPKAEQQADVKILDVFGSAATVRLEMRDWIDYLHVVKVGGEWKIVNVLWEMKR